MNQQTSKYPSRADTLALLKAREKGVAAAAARSIAPANRTDAPVCVILPQPESR